MKIVYSLPDKIVTNDELAALYEGLTAEKIIGKTGIASRHVVGEIVVGDHAECGLRDGLG